MTGADRINQGKEVKTMPRCPECGCFFTNGKPAKEKQIPITQGFAKKLMNIMSIEVNNAALNEALGKLYDQGYVIRVQK